MTATMTSRSVSQLFMKTNPRARKIAGAALSERDDGAVDVVFEGKALGRVEPVDARWRAVRQDGVKLGQAPAREDAIKRLIDDYRRAVVRLALAG